MPDTVRKKAKPSVVLVLIIFAAIQLITSTPYYFSLDSFFANDDFVEIYFYRDYRLFPPGEFFNPQVLWFYRPTQRYLFELLYHTFGLQPVPFNLANLSLYFSGAWLWFLLLLRLLRNRLLCLLTMLFFLVNWEFCDVVFWKANYGTNLSWLGTLLTLHAFLFYLRERKKWWYGLTLFFFAFSLCSKETSVNVPFLALLLFFIEKISNQDSSLPINKKSIYGGIKSLSWLFVVLVIYLIFHLGFVEDVQKIDKKGYVFSSPLSVIRNFLFALNHLLFFFAGSPLLKFLNPLWEFLRSYFLFLPLLIFYLAWRSKDKALLLGILFAAIGLFPQILLTDFHASRFYLLPAAGFALVWARLVYLSLESLKTRKNLAAVIARLAIVVLVVYAILSSELRLFYIVNYDRENTMVLKKFYHFLSHNRTKFPADSLFIFRGISDQVTHEGLGLREMVKLALKSDKAEGLKREAWIEPEFADYLNQSCPYKYFIFLNQTGTVETEEIKATRNLKNQ